MDLVRNSQTWLAARIVLMREQIKGTLNDRGEGPVSYLAIIILIGLVAAAIFGLDIHNDIARGIDGTIQAIWNRGQQAGGGGS